jgi:hypothetical protein
VNGLPAGNGQSTFTDFSLNNGDLISCRLTSNLSCANPDTAISNAITITVTNHLVPTISISADTTTVCAGTNVTFTSSITGGGNNPVYFWEINHTPAGNGSTFSSANLVNGAIVSCELTSSAGCARPDSALSNNVTIAVKPVVTPAINIAATPAAICLGSVDTVHANISNGGITPLYLWLLNNHFLNNTGAVYITDSLQSGDSVQCVLISSAQCAQPDTITSNSAGIIVNQIPNAIISPAANAGFCPGDSVLLTADPASATYKWSTHATTQNIYVNVAGHYTVTVTNANVIAYQQPATPAITQLHDTLVAPVAAGYQWYLNDTAIVGGTGQTQAAKLTGTYSVQITDSNGCTATSAGLVISSIGELSQAGDISVYPNPTNDYWHLVASNELVGSSLEIYNAEGQIVFKSEVHGENLLIDALPYATGIYELRIISFQQILVRRLMKI